MWILYHTTSDSIERVGAETSTSGDSPTEQEGSKKVTLKRTNEDNRLERIVHTEVETSVDDNTSDGGTETAIQTTNTVGSKGLLVDIDQTVELTFTTYDGQIQISKFPVFFQKAYLSLRIWRRWPIGYGHNPGSRRRGGKRHQRHHQKPSYQQTTSSNHLAPS